jgi:hypothetical protein
MVQSSFEEAAMADSLAEMEPKLRKQAKQIRDELRSFERSAEVFSSERQRLVDQYDNKWVGVFDGRIVGSADSLKRLLSMLKKRGIPAAQTAIEKIDREEKILILNRDA